MLSSTVSIVYYAFFIVAVTRAVSVEKPIVEEPSYNRNFRYVESMKTSASEVPFQGGYNRVFEGGYYPAGYANFRNGFGPGFGSYGGYNGLDSQRYTNGPFFPGYKSPYIGSGSFGPGFGFGGGLFPHGNGGEYVDKKYYDAENKKVDGETFQKAQGSKGESGQHGSEGFTTGQIAVKDIKGDSGYYNDAAGDKKVVSDGKFYQGGEHYNTNGGKGDGENNKANHRKGYVKKGFKKSHHKDEAENEETFYDEAHDEGDKFHYNGNEGSFGQKGQSGYKGGHEVGGFVADEKKKQGHFEKQHIVDNANADKGQYGQKGYHGSSEGFSVNNGFGQQSLLGKQEANRVYHNHYPHGYVPFYPGY